MTDPNSVPVAAPVQAVIDTVNADADKILNDPLGADLVAKAEAKIPSKVRGAIYEAAKWIGVAIAAGSLAVGLLEGTPQLYVGTGVGILIALNNLLAKAHLTQD